MNDENNKGNAAAVIEVAREAAAAKLLDVKVWGNAEQIVITPDGSGGADVQTVRDLFSGLKPAPDRRDGKITTHDLASFIAATNRDKRADTIIFADLFDRKLTAVLDFHGVADSAPRWMQDRVAYEFKLSPALNAWLRAEQQGVMDQRTFARLIDDRLGDIGGNPPADSIAARFAARLGIRFATVADLAVFTRTIAAKSTTESEEQIDENTGDVHIQYKKKGDVKTPDGKPVAVPQAFCLSIPILNGIGATEYAIAVRLRYDIGERGIAWRLQIHALDQYLQAAMEEAVTTVRKAAPEGCGLPVYMASAP